MHFPSILLLLSSASLVGAALPTQAPADTPWDDLKDALSSPDILTALDLNQWASQCVDPFVGADPEGTFSIVSNYELLNQTSGLCMDHVSCAYKDCFWPFFPPGESPFPTDRSPFVLFEGDIDPSNLYEEKLNLPAMVLHPKSSSDIVTAVTFCKEHQIGVTVKVAGHSYFGSSTARGTLLIKMSTYYPRYAIDGSLTECDALMDADTESALSMACAVAGSRNKKAVLRVGGGEMFDHAYRAVSIEWNGKNGTNKYHLVGGGAGTVAAAGGWTASGGLSGTTGMRMYGVGIDQVIHIEMVLPSGQHVRFGPSAWEEDADYEFPKTTEVRGFCNTNPFLEESDWQWVDCNEIEPDIDFEGLWFAVRGGGGGTWGVVTSLHYQLHDYPGLLGLVSTDPTNLFLWDGWGEESGFTFGLLYVRFCLQFLYRPDDLNVTEAESRGCSSAMTANLNPFVGGLYFCYGSSAETMVSKWQEFISAEASVAALQSAGVPDEMIEALPSIMSFDQAESYAILGLSDGSDPRVPAGRLSDSPRADVIPLLGSYPNYVDSGHTHIPIDLLTANDGSFDGMATLIAIDVLTYGSTGTIYAMGGAIPLVDDQVNSLAPARRNAAFLKAVPDEDLRAEYYKAFFGEADMMSDDFPGTGCHNHALIYEMGPVKSNWTKPCPGDLSQDEREELCVSQGASFWGTTNLARLESVKAGIDPDSLFICAAGIGYTSEDEAATDAPATANPATAVPGTAAPVTAVPDTGAPVTAVPDTGGPVTAVPDTGAPATANPATTVPDTGAPATASPVTAVPDTPSPTVAPSGVASMLPVLSVVLSIVAGSMLL